MKDKMKIIPSVHSGVTEITPDKQALLCKLFHFKALRPHQLAAVSAMHAGRDILMTVNTGGGKSEAILGAKLLNPEHGLHVQIEPLRALQGDMRDRMAALGIRVEVLNSDLSPLQFSTALQKIKHGAVDCVLTTPEQLEKSAVFHALNEISVSFLAVDECHCLVEWGGEFRPAYDRIGSFIQHLDSRPIVAACTATLTPDAEKKVRKSLHLRDPVRICGSIDRPEIRQLAVEIGTDLTDRTLIRKERFSRLKSVLKEYAKDGSVIVYCTSVTQTREVTEWLQRKGFDAEPFYAALPHAEKERIRQRFRTEKRIIIVGTSAFSMGIDKSNIRLVVHMSMPLSIEDYWQKTGRAGRDGKKSISLVLWHRLDFNINAAIVGYSGKKYKKLQRLRDFLQCNQCFAQQLRNYFGQSEGKTCGRCSICKPKF